MIKWRIGCSGFHYKHWKELFYPKELPQRRWFEYYCQHFDTVELNATFYRFPRLAYLQSWYDQSPEAFYFSVKAPRWITHFNQFRNSTNMISDFYGLASEGLRSKLGPVLFQLPPKMTYTEERLSRIVNALDPTFRNVVEFRHESWWNNEVYAALARKNITFCGMSHPELPDLLVQNTSTVYYRFHGTPVLYKSSYPEDQLQHFQRKLSASISTGTAFIYFNNDIDAAAISNALKLIKLVQKG